MAKDTKDRILAAALELFSQNGYAGTNIRELTASLGLGKSSMYRHFESKEEIWNRLLDEMIAYYGARFGSPEHLPPVPDSPEGLVAMTMRMVDFTIHDENVVKTRKLLTIEQFRDDRARALATKHFLTGLRDMFTPIFAGMMDRGLLRRDDPAMLAFAYTAPISALIHLCDREPDKTEAAIAQIEAFSRFFLRVCGQRIMAKPSEPILIRPLQREETESALRLAWQVFARYESPDYPPEGTAEFKKTLKDSEYLAGIRYYGAFDQNDLVGVLGIREETAHLCFFFVDGAYHRRGIGTRLFRRMRQDFPNQTITLNSSPCGLPFYTALGFSATDSEKTVNGIRFTPMLLRGGACGMETERLILDGLRDSDKADYFHSISHDRKVLETFICRYAETPEDLDFSSYPGRRDLFAIRRKETGRLIGILSLFDEKDGACEIGYGIGSDHWGQGYATEAVRRFLKYLLDERRFQTVFASCFPENEASRRVMEKCGMRYDHFSEKELTYLGVERDLAYYAIRRRPGVILLNGPSSAGKSSIAKALRQKLGDSENTVAVSLDDHLQMTATEPIWEDDVFSIMPHMCEHISTALQDGKTVIVDHVITSSRIYRTLTHAVAGFQMKTVLVSCDLGTLRRREADRGDRCVGSAEASARYLYPKTGYDLCIDSSRADPAALAEVIIRSLS